MERESKRQIVFVVGAGASHPYGFPLGGELKDAIVQSLEGGNVVRSALEKLGHSSRRVESFRHDLMGSGSYTIDDFLSDRSDYLDIGRFCVGFQIHQREAIIQRSLADRPQPKFDWIARLFQKDIFPDLSAFLSSEYAVVTFNYDRLFEIFLGRCLAARFKLPPDEAARAVGQFPITHVHGSLGEVVGKDLSPMLMGEVKYDESFFCEVHDRSDSLDFSHDPVSPRQVGARKLLESARNVVFLGFGFGEKNLSRLGIDVTGFDSIVGTGFGLKSRDRKRVEGALPGIAFEGDSDTACLDVLDGVLSGEHLDNGLKTKKQKLLIMSMEDQIKAAKVPRATAVFHETELTKLAKKVGITEDETSDLLADLVFERSLSHSGMDGYRLV